MKYRLTAVLAAILLTACGSGDTSPAPPPPPQGKVEVLCMSTYYRFDDPVCDSSALGNSPSGIAMFNSGEVDLTSGYKTLAILNNTSSEPRDVTYIFDAFVNGCGGDYYKQGNVTVPADGTVTVYRHAENYCGGILNSPNVREFAVYNGTFTLPSFGYPWGDEWPVSLTDDWDWALLNSYIGESPLARGESHFIHNSP